MLKVRTSFNIVAGGATELSGCDFSAEVEMRQAEGEGEIARVGEIGRSQIRNRPLTQSATKPNSAGAMLNSDSAIPR
jgi:hypothetical protein